MSWQYADSVVWGDDNSGNPSELLKPGDDNVILAGWPQGKPNRQYMNWILWVLHNNVNHLEVSGWAPWSEAVTYGTYAVVRYGTRHYVSLQSPNLNKNPDTETSYWKDYYVWLTEQAGQASTNQTVANYNEGYFYPHPTYVNGTTINLTGNNLLLTDLQIYPLSANPLAITVPTLVAQTWYYIYVEIPAGSDIIAGDVSITTTPPSYDPALQMFYSGTKRCIGYIEGHNSGNGEAEPFITANGWYQRRDEKRKLALYTPSPQVNTTLYAGVPSFAGKGLIEIASYCYEEEKAAFAYADATGFSTPLGDENHGWGSAPANQQYNGQIVAGTSSSIISAAMSIGGVSMVITDVSGNILVSGHNTETAQDEAMAIWLRKFKLPRGIYTA